MTLSDFQWLKYSMTRSIVQSLCNSWGSCHETRRSGWRRQGNKFTTVLGSDLANIWIRIQITVIQIGIPDHFLLSLDVLAEVCALSLSLLSLSLSAQFSFDVTRHDCHVNANMDLSWTFCSHWSVGSRYYWSEITVKSSLLIFLKYRLSTDQPIK